MPVVLITVLALLALVSACGAEPGRGPAFGVQFHGIWSDYTDPERVAVLDALAEAGVTRVRIDASWAQLQPGGPDEYDPAGVELLDRVLAMATERGLRPLVMFWLTPQWANDGVGERALPHDPGDYARAVGWAAERYRGQVDWEVWNEPNSEDFLVGADPAGYAALLRSAYPAVKKADPSASVVAGSVQYNDVGWLAAMYDAGAAGSFDVLSTHPYQSPSDLPPEADDNGTRFRLRHVAAVRDLMVDRGDADVPIWFTEVGWSTRPGEDVPWQRGVTGAEQAGYLVRTLRLVRTEYPYVTAVFAYTDRDGPPVLRRSHVDGYGLMTHDLRPKQALAALRAELRERA